jgi:hypothetical protein
MAEAYTKVQVEGFARPSNRDSCASSHTDARVSYDPRQAFCLDTLAMATGLKKLKVDVC